MQYFANFKFLYLLFGSLFCFLISITFDVMFIPTIEMPGEFYEIRKARIEWVLKHIAAEARPAIN